MKTKDLYQTINAMVRKHTGIEMPSLIFSNKEECVDARYTSFIFFPSFLPMMKSPVKRPLKDSQ